MMREGVRGAGAAEERLPRWFGTVMTVLRRARAGSLEIVLPGGRVFRIDGPAPGPHGRIEVLDGRLFGRILREGETGFAEAYMDGWWRTPDLQALLDMLLANNAELGRSLPGAALVRLLERIRHWLNDNGRVRARRNIARHYDLGNDFYALWLDPSMTYSSALFQGSQESLEAAQANKYAAVCDGIGIRPGDHVLEIGCGWGGFAEHAARHRGARVTALTISAAQAEYARRRIFEAGLAERVEICLRDYRDERGRYDGVASIEMFEAVGERWWPVYFGALRERLQPGGRAALQVITIADHLFERYRRSVDFVQKHIFPGGMLPSPSALGREAAAAGLERLGSREFGASYSETLRRWHDTFAARWDEVRRLGFDERFRRMWSFYLAVCASCFRAGTTDVTLVTLRRPA